MNTGFPESWAVADSSAETRISFIHKTYQHVALAVAVFVGVEAAFLQIPGIENLVFRMGGMAWLLVMGLFMLVSSVANKWALNTVTPGKAYMGLGLYIIAEALVFLPMMYWATHFAGPDVIVKAGVITAIVFGGLTAFVLLSKKDFSFLRTALSIGFFAALGIIVVSVLFGFSLGSLFAGAMVLLMAGAIIYQTSNVLHHYRPGQHVAAALALFSSVATLFWYVLMLVGGDRD